MDELERLWLAYLNLCSCNGKQSKTNALNRVVNHYISLTSDTEKNQTLILRNIQNTLKQAGKQWKKK